MKMSVFEVRGSFAHYRKFYANSTSLSYEFPPRTTVCGLIAGILGIDKDQYYAAFNEDKAFVAVQIVNPTKRLSQTVNYMRVKSTKDLNGSSGPMQIPVEWIVHRDGVGHGQVCYRIYFAHKDKELHSKLIDLLQRGKSYYPPYLGITEAIGSMHWIGEFEAEEMVHAKESLEIATVCPTALLEDIHYSQLDGVRRTYMRDRIPCDFDSERRLKGIAQVIYEPNGYPVTATVKSQAYCIHIHHEPVYIVPLVSRNLEGE